MTYGGASAGYVGFLFGIFCAWWAQSTRRNPWVWFFCGWILPPVTGLVLLWKTAQAHPSTPNLEDRGREDLLATRKDVI